MPDSLGRRARRSQIIGLAFIICPANLRDRLHMTSRAKVQTSRYRRSSDKNDSEAGVPVVFLNSLFAVEKRASERERYRKRFSSMPEARRGSRRGARHISHCKNLPLMHRGRAMGSLHGAPNGRATRARPPARIRRRPRRALGAGPRRSCSKLGHLHRSSCRVIAAPLVVVPCGRSGSG